MVWKEYGPPVVNSAGDPHHSFEGFLFVVIKLDGICPDQSHMSFVYVINVNVGCRLAPASISIYDKRVAGAKAADILQRSIPLHG
jgi:hypothetical protein